MGEGEENRKVASGWKLFPFLPEAATCVKPPWGKGTKVELF